MSSVLKYSKICSDLPKFSVVMAVYINDIGDEFRTSINSLLCQTCLPSEIVIVVDGFVKEDILKILDECKKNSLFKIIQLEENGGLSNALNIGVVNSKNDIIARMDADDICLSDRFEKQIKYLVESNLDIVGGQIVEFKTNFREPLSRRLVPLDHDAIVKFMKYRSPFSHPAIIFRKKVLEDLNGYSVSFKGSALQDYDFFVRAYLKGFKFGNIKDDVLFYRLGASFKAMTRRRWGKKYAKSELILYWNFYKLKFYSLFDLLLNILLKIPLRLLPFPIFHFVYYLIGRRRVMHFDRNKV
jgi:glycosyltransferase involved in cell wall biosynthesis